MLDSWNCWGMLVGRVEEKFIEIGQMNNGKGRNSGTTVYCRDKSLKSSMNITESFSILEASQHQKKKHMTSTAGVAQMLYPPKRLIKMEGNYLARPKNGK